MKAAKHPGKCRLCGQLKELTEEHVPPKNAFNSGNVKTIPFEEMIKVFSGKDGRMLWDVHGLKGTVRQGGNKDYYLCRECNNNTGAWYIRAYTDLAKALHTMIQREQLQVGQSISFTLKNLYPLRIFKAKMTMICDINLDCFGDDNLRQFLINKTEKTIDPAKYSLYMYLVSPQMPRISGLSGLINFLDPNNPVLVSEVSEYPIGFALYKDKPDGYHPFGLNINHFATYDYDTVCDMDFDNVPYLDINSQFPADYRSKEEIILCAKDTTQ